MNDQFYTDLGYVIAGVLDLMKAEGLTELQKRSLVMALQYLKDAR